MPAESARNMGQSLSVAGVTEVGSVHRAGEDNSDGMESVVRGAMEIVPCTCQQSQANGIQ